MNLKEKLAALQKSLLDIKAAAEGREFTDAEMVDIEAKSAEAVELKATIERQQKGDALLAAIGGVVDAEPASAFAGALAKSLGEHFVKHAGAGLVQAKSNRQPIAAPEFKAAADVHVIPSSIAPALTQVDTNIVTGVRRRLTVADLLGTENISGNAITYFVEAGMEGGFTTVGENGQKPQIHFADPVAVTESLKKIAAFIKESDEIIEDAPWLVSAINGRLLYNLGLFEENQILAGGGTGTDLTGLLTRVGIQTETAIDKTDNADALFRAITKVATGSGLDADGIVINPADYQKLRLSKDANGQYFGGGFFGGQYGNGGIQEQPPLWGLRTVVTPAITAGTVLVGAFAQGGSVIRKGGVRVESTNSDASDFTNNRVTIRAEERLALAVRRPGGFVKVTLSAAEPA